MKPLFLLILVTVSLCISSCVATHDDVGPMYARQSRLEAKVEKLSKQVNEIHSGSGTVSDGNSKIDSQIFQLEVKVYDLEQKISILESSIDNLKKNIKVSGVKTTSFPRLSDTGATKSLPSAPKTLPKPTQEKIQQQAEEKIQQKVEPAVKEKSQFDVAYKDFTLGNYANARRNFRAFLREDPNSPKAPEVAFLIADSYYKEELYEEAILEYQTVIDIYPRDSRVPLSYLKQGLSLMKLNKAEEAKLFLQTLVDRYPDSPEAGEARKKISELETEIKVQ